MNSEELRRQLIKAVRGKVTQKQLSENLGFAYNQVYRWESGLKEPSWLDFVSICDNCDADINRATAELCADISNPDDYQKVVSCIFSGRSTTEIAQDLSISRSKVGRWKNGQTCPRLVDMLQIIVKYCTNYIDFFAILAPPEELSVLREQYSFHSGIHDLIEQHPYAGAVLWALKTKTYLHANRFELGVIAKLVGIKDSDAEKCLEFLEKLGLAIRKRGNSWCRRRRSEPVRCAIQLRNWFAVTGWKLPLKNYGDIRQETRGKT